MVAKLAADPQLQDEVRNAIAELRGATTRAKKASSPSSHKKRNSFILAGIMIGILCNPGGPDTRKWLRRGLRSEETFEFEATEAFASLGFLGGRLDRPPVVQRPYSASRYSRISQSVTASENRRTRCA